MRRLSKPLAAMRPAYGAVVIGSGYGGGIAASRLARMGRSYITGVIDLRRADRPLSAGYVIEDGAPPGAVGHLVSKALQAAALAMGDDPEGDLRAEARSTGYGHIDCIFGKSAVDDVHPHFVRHFDQTA